MKKLTSILALTMLFGTLATPAQAGTDYHVYIKDGECTIETRDPDTFKKQRGSSWEYIGKDTTRSGAKKIAKNAGCD